MEEQVPISAPLVSIIVPVYNAEATLRRCLDSVCRQTLNEFELLLVDDGSSDASGQICDEYAAADARIRVLHKPNSGVSDSRNLAISQARGRYLQFLDSDDWLVPDASEQLVRMAEAHGCELVVSDFYRVVDDRLSHKGDIPEDGLLTREEFAEYMMEKPADFYYGVLWNKLFRRDIVEAHGLRMNPEISWCEDFMFNLEYIRYTRRIYILRVPIYYYVKTKHSLSSAAISLTKTVQMKRIVFEQYDKFYRDVFPEEDSTASHMQVYRFLLDAASDGLVPPAILPGSQRLGQERIRVSPSALEGDGILADLYRNRKCLNVYLVSVAFRNDLTLDEVYLLFCLSKFRSPCTRRDLAEFSGLAQRKTSSLLLRLQRRNYITVATVKEPKERRAAKKARTEEGRASSGHALIEIQLLPPAQDLLYLLQDVEEQYNRDRFAGLTQEEIDQYTALSHRIQDNMNQILSR
ncbi:MAG: glycosyltransferase [Oscillospiraceae bacterium]|nr:glycosyltransferase [Oscillospiraceae bacterium]